MRFNRPRLAARNVERIKNGPVNLVIRAQGPALAMFRKRERNKLLIYAGGKAGQAWRAKRVWKRFAPQHVTKPPWNYSLDKRTPLQESGEMRKKVYTGKITARAPRGVLSVKIGLPAGHPVRPEIAAVMATVPPSEIEFFAEVMGDALEKEIGNATIKKPPTLKRRGRAVLNRSQRQRFGVTKKRRR